MEGERIDKVKKYTKEIIDELLENTGNNAALISFDTTSSIHSELTNDKVEMINKLNSLSVTGNTNYYQALVNVDTILKKYTKEEDREMVVLFLTDGLPNENTPSEVGQYNYLKSKYSYVTFNAIQYEMGSSILEPIKKISDYQYVANMDTLNNVLFDVAIPAYDYERFTIKDIINSDNFYIESKNDIDFDVGEIEYNKNTNEIYWRLNNFKSGRNGKLKIKVKLNDNLIGSGGVFPTNIQEEVDVKFKNLEEKVDSSNTPILADYYRVIYDANVPSGCEVVGNIPDSKNYSVFDTVEFTRNELSCENYQFKGWEISTKNVSRLNDDYFIMPEKDVFIRAKWSKLNIVKSMDGKVQETLTLYKQVQNDLENPSKYVKRYTGLNSSPIGNEQVYYYYDQAQNNNVLFANYCWKIVRTTDTGGVKLLYNGVPDVSGGCNNEGENTSLTKEQMNTTDNMISFNTSKDSLAYVGYMYNKAYQHERFRISSLYKVFLEDFDMESNERYSYFYSDTIEFNDSKYNLIDASNHNWVKSSQELVGKYTCRSTTDTSCTSVYYVVGVISNTMYVLELKNGEDYNSVASVTLGESISENVDGSYSLLNTVQLGPLEWYRNYSKYANYYTCGSDLLTCDGDSMSKIHSTTNAYYIYRPINNIYKFGNNFIYEDGKYTLVDTIDVIDYNKSVSTINNYHYTCFNASGVCDEVKYI